MNRHEQRKAATHHALLGAAREVIVERGYSAVDILDITERANVSKATFYKHFSNKEDAVRELMLMGFDALREQIFEGGRRATSREQWVVASIRQAFHWGAENREILQIMIGGGVSAQLNAFARRYMVESVWQAFDEFDPLTNSDGLPAEVKIQAVSGVLFQFMAWWLAEDTGYTAEGMTMFVIQALTHGVGLVKA